MIAQAVLGRGQTERQTNKQTRLNALPHAGGYTASVGNNNNNKFITLTFSIEVNLTVNRLSQMVYHWVIKCYFVILQMTNDLQQCLWIRGWLISHEASPWMWLIHSYPVLFVHLVFLRVVVNLAGCRPIVTRQKARSPQSPVFLLTGACCATVNSPRWASQQWVSIRKQIQTSLCWSVTVTARRSAESTERCGKVEDVSRNFWIDRHNIKPRWLHRQYHPHNKFKIDNPREAYTRQIREYCSIDITTILTGQSTVSVPLIQLICILGHTTRWRSRSQFITRQRVDISEVMVQVVTSWNREPDRQACVIVFVSDHVIRQIEVTFPLPDHNETKDVYFYVIVLEVTSYRRHATFWPPSSLMTSSSSLSQLKMQNTMYLLHQMQLNTLLFMLLDCVN